MRTFALISGVHACNLGPDDRMGPSYTQRRDGTYEEEAKGAYVKLQMFPIVPQRIEYVRWSNIKEELTHKGYQPAELKKTETGEWT